MQNLPSSSAPSPQHDLSLLRNLRDSILAGTHPLFRVPARLYPLPVKTTITTPLDATETEQSGADDAALQEPVEQPRLEESGAAVDEMILDDQPAAPRELSDAPTELEDGEEEEGELIVTEAVKAEQPNEIEVTRSEDVPTTASLPAPTATAPTATADVEVLILDDDDDDDNEVGEEQDGLTERAEEMANPEELLRSAAPANSTLAAGQNDAAPSADVADDASLPDYVDSDEDDDDDFDPSILVARTTVAPAATQVEELLILDDEEEEEEDNAVPAVQSLLPDASQTVFPSVRSPSPSGVNPHSTTSPVPGGGTDSVTKESSLPPAQRHATSLSLRLKLEKERLAAAEARLAAAKEATASRDASPTVTVNEPATQVQIPPSVPPVPESVVQIAPQTDSDEPMPPTPSSDVVIVENPKAPSPPPPRSAKAASPAPSSGSTVSRQSTATTTSSRPTATGNAEMRPSSGSVTTASSKDGTRKRARADPGPPRARQSRGRSRSISPRRDPRSALAPPRGRPADPNPSRGPMPPPSHTGHRRQFSGDDGRDDRRPFVAERARSPPRFYLDRPGPPPMARPYSPPPPQMRGGRYSLSPPRRSLSPPGRRPLSPFRRPVSPPRRPMSPPRRAFSPPRYPLSPPRRAMSPPRRPMSPPRRPLSPLARPLTPPGFRQYGGPPGLGSFDARSRRSPSPPPKFGPPPGMYRDDLDRRPSERFERYDGPGEFGRPRSPPASFYAQRGPPAMPPPTVRDFPPPMPSYAQTRPPPESYSSRPRSPVMPPPPPMGFRRPMSPPPQQQQQQQPAFELYDNRPLAPYPGAGPVWIDRNERDRQDRDRRFDPNMPPPPQARGGMMQPSYLPQQSAPMVPPPPPPGYPLMYGTPPIPAEFERFHRPGDDFARGAPPPPPPTRPIGPPHQGHHQGPMPPPGRRMPMPPPPPPGARR